MLMLEDEAMTGKTASSKCGCAAQCTLRGPAGVGSMIASTARAI